MPFRCEEHPLDDGDCIPFLSPINWTIVTILPTIGLFVIAAYALVSGCVNTVVGRKHSSYSFVAKLLGVAWLLNATVCRPRNRPFTRATSAPVAFLHNTSAAQIATILKALWGVVGLVS